MIKVAILDDHNMVLRGLENMLQDSGLVDVIACYSRGKALLKGLRETPVDVLLLDINLPDSNGLDLCKELRKDYPNMEIIGLSNYSETSFIKNMLRNGAKAYLLKNTDKKELINAIMEVQRGNKYLPESIKEALLNESIGEQNESLFIPKLTRREKEVLQLIIKENTSQEIADRLCISSKTVENHRSNLIQKLGVKNTAGIVRVAIEKGLMD